MTADWVDLMPEDDLAALLNPPSYLDEIADGSSEDALTNKFNNTNKVNTDEVKTNQENSLDQAIAAENDALDKEYQKALTSTRVIDALNGAPIRIPTFIVPLEFDDNQKVTQFFMVPYYGACIHLPPPPPNQTIFVNYPQGITVNSITEPYWISGILKTSLVENDLATAAYTMEIHHFELYMEDGMY
ncbi:DUF3299 domain-containing protein [Colwellia sp. E2M01]|nr:DUF3299 domain-containing protein [Colwellia sp. E2M01]